VNDKIRRLHAARPRNRFLRLSIAALALLVCYSWLAGDLGFGGLFGERTARNLDRFLGELRPYPLQGRDWDWGVFADWVQGRVATHAGDAVLVTLALSVAAIVLAGVAAALLSVPAARTVATPEPFLPAPRPPDTAARLAWRIVMTGTRVLLVVLRAIPEYVWAFLMLKLLGPGAWPAVIALALHNAGVLGKLGAEVVENLDPASLRAMRAMGATRRQIAVLGIYPASLNRFLLYFFYRWETCVREATVLGLLGVISLGYWIQDARARVQYDVMLLYIVLGALIILVGDFVSAFARGIIRRAR